MECLLCLCANIKIKYRVQNRAFFQCPECELIQVAAPSRLQAEEERARYLLHENIDTADYRKFLCRLALPLIEKIQTTHKGLDYGSGTFPLMEKIFREKGYSMDSYDPFFLPAAELLTNTYDFITCSEVAEHFFHPGDEFRRLFSLLERGGFLALMTEPVPSEFVSWHYHRDPTHVVFYAKKTMLWIGKAFEAHVEFISPSVTIFKKRN